jgi:outer membrane protein assembly factor BamB
MLLTFSQGKRILCVLGLVVLMGLSACGQTNVGSSHTLSGNVPVGTGSTPEAGTNGQPQPSPHGHGDSIIASGNIAYVGSDNGRVYAFGASNGGIDWQRNLGGVVFVFAVTGGVVYVTGEGTSTTVYALDASTGAVKWRFQPSVSIVSVMVGDGEVFASTGSGGNKMTVFALRATTGALLWQYLEPTALPGMLGVVNGTLYLDQLAGTLPNSTSTLLALDAGTGRMLWQEPIKESDGAISGAPVETNGLLYLETTFGAVYALQATSGTEMWHVVSGSLVPGVQPIPLSPDSPVVAEGVVYAGGPEGITAYRASDGTVIWHYQKSLAGPLQPQLVLVSGVIYVEAFGLVAALDAADGSVVWQHPAEGGVPTSGPLVVTNGLVISGGPAVYALRATDGTQVWQSSISPGGEGDISAGKQMAVAGGVVYLGTDDGVVHAIRATDGSSLWQYAIPELPVPTPPVYSASVTFSQATSYQQAIEIVTNLGLQTKLLCTYQWANSDTASTFSNSHTLLVQSTVASAPLWMGRLLATSGVESAQSADGTISCPFIQPTNAPPYLGSQQAGGYVQVAFASTVSYSAALEGIDGLGFRLANPCYEQARANGSKQPCQPRRRTGNYAKSERLVMATTSWNATTWLDQLPALAGASQITTPYTTTC